jgi:hypothetical protein
MRTLLTILDSTCRRLVLLAGVAFLLAAGGCSLERNEDEGDPRKFLAEYRVSISKSTVVLTEQKPTDDQVTLSVTCVPLNGSPNCAIDDPDWWNNDPTPLVIPIIKDRHKATTKATLVLNQMLLPIVSESLRKSSLLGAQETVLMSFFPTEVPDKVHVTGRQWIEIQFPYGSSPVVRQDDAADKPVLEIFPRTLTMRPSDTAWITNDVVIHYKGPPTYLLGVVLSGDNSANFRLSLPLFPFPVGKNALLMIHVIFTGLVTPNNNTIYYAKIKVIAENGATEYMTIRAYR